MMIAPEWIDELTEFVRIPSISADPSHASDLVAAARWVARLVEAVGGTATLVEGTAPPIVRGLVPASDELGLAAPPVVLLYGHYDVQPPGDLAGWHSPPFAPEVRDGWLYGRGATDDKGNLYALLKAVQRLRARRRLPVDVLVLSDGEEEVLGTSVCDHIADAGVSADAALVFDAPMISRDLPAFIVGGRGMVYLKVAVTGNATGLHSGLYGGAALNAAHVLIDVLRAVVDDAAVLPDTAVPQSADERATWDRLEPGDRVLAACVALPADARAAAEFYPRTLARGAIDVTSLSCGDPDRQANVIPATARAHVSVRLAPGQAAAETAERATALLRAAAPAGVRVDVETTSLVDASLVAAGSEPLRRARDAFERVLGVTPPLLRTGGSLPVVGALERAGIPVVLTGFAPAEARVHAADERFALAHLDQAVATATETLLAFGQMAPRRLDAMTSNSTVPRP